MAYINGNEILFSAIINGGGGGSGEAIPNFNEVEGFRVFLEGLEGEINVGYSVLEKVALPAGYPAILASVSDKNFIADNIKKGVNIFGLVGAFEGEGNQWLGEYVDGTGYKTGAIVSYEGNIYICIKDLDEMQDPTYTEYWEMLNEESEAEDIPEFDEVEDFELDVSGLDTELEIGYSVSEKVVLPAGRKILAYIEDENYTPSNIKKDVYLFGLKGEYEGEGGDDSGTSADMVAEGNYAEVNLPNATMIKIYAFYNDKVLTKISMPKVKKIWTYAFYGCIKLNVSALPEGLTSIAQYAFQNCTSLALTELPETLTELNSGAFQGCTKLALTKLPNGLKTIGDNCFRDCTKITLTEIPSGIEKVENYAFRNCTGLTTITFKSKPTVWLRSSAFNGCTNLTTINVPWAEGEVEDAPWGATNATINYNYTGE